MVVQANEWSRQSRPSISLISSHCTAGRSEQRFFYQPLPEGLGTVIVHTCSLR